MIRYEMSNIKPLFSAAWLMIVTVACVATVCNGSSEQTGWGWKRSEAPDDVMDFLNTKRTYRQKIRRAEITAAGKQTYVDFITFYQPDRSGDKPQDWGFKKAAEPNDVVNFLNAKPPYTRKIQRAQVAAVNGGSHVEFFVFHQSDPNARDEPANWSFKRARTPDDAVNFLNTKPPYTLKIKRAEIAAVNRGTHLEFVVFYQRGQGNRKTSWDWKKSTKEDDVRAFLSGEGPYSKPVTLAEVVALSRPARTEFYVFYTR